LEAHGAGVAGNIVRAGEDHNHFGMKLNYILAEADEHLRRGLAADAAIDVGLAGKIFVEMPDVGDGVSEEDDAVLAGRGRLERGVGFAIAGEFAEVIAESGSLRVAVLLAGLVGSEGWGWLLGQG